MQYTGHYESPLGTMLLAADDEGLTGVWFEEQKYYACGLASEHENKRRRGFSSAPFILRIDLFSAIAEFPIFSGNS